MSPLPIGTPEAQQGRQQRRMIRHQGPAPDQTQVHTLAGINEGNQLLARLLARANLDVNQITVSNNNRRLRRMKNWPIPGGNRYIVPSQGFGGILALASGTPTLALAHNESRLAGQIVNSGSVAVILQLCGAELAASGQMAPTIWLGANGGSWDFLMSHVLWGGAVTATAQGGAGTITIAEV